MAIVVGITGGIGSGKSTICEVFKLLGVPVFEADSIARQLMNTHPEIKKGLINLFGDEIYIAESVLDRKKLADIIFNDHLQLAKTNALVHPIVRNEFNSWIKKQDTKYVLHEAAILFESGFYKMMDFTILVSAPEDQRIERVVQRDGTSSKLVKERIDKQWRDEKKREFASVEIKNDNNDLVIPQIIKIDKQLKEYGKIW